MLRFFLFQKGGKGGTSPTKMITKSKAALVSMLRSTLPELDQITVETSPDISAGPGIMLKLDSSLLKPVSGALSTGTISWRIAYVPDVSGSTEDIYSAFDKIIEAAFDKPMVHSMEKVPYKFTKADVERNDEGIYLKVSMATTIQKNATNYDPMKDVQLSTGG